MWGLKNVLFRSYDALSRMSWQEFEHLIARHYSDRGYRVEHVGTGTGSRKFDGGIDLKLYRENQYIVVQCKHWNAKQVPHNCVHELLGVMTTQHATGAILVTTGEYTQAAKIAAAEEPRLQLIDGTTIRALLGPVAGLEVSPQVPYLGAAQPWMTATPRARHDGHVPTRLALFVGLLAVAMATALVFYAVLGVSRIVEMRVTPHSASGVASALARNAQLLVRESANDNGLRSPKVATPPASRNEPMTDDELKASKRKNDEAMKILEKTTPEI
jgi:restriction system protein